MGDPAWSNPDVVPAGFVRTATGERAVVRRRGWIRIVLGALVLLAGVGALVAGGVGFVRMQDALFDGAAARGQVAGPAVSFEAEAQPYTVLILTPDRLANEFDVEREVGATVCTATLADGSSAEVRGARQGVSTVTDRGRTIGWFAAPAGPTAVACTWTRSVAVDARAFVVTEGRPSVDALPFVVGSALLAVGVLLVVWGIRGRVVVARA